MLSIFLATNAVALPSSSALLKVLASGALLSRPPRGVVSLSGPDARRLLHQQSSNAIEGTAANTVLDTAVLNGQGRIRDLVTAAVLPDELLVVTGVAADLAKVFDLYIFPADDVAAADASADWSVLALAGAGAGAAMEGAALGSPPAAGQLAELPGGAGYALDGCGLDAPGCTLLVRSGADADRVCGALEAQPGVVGASAADDALLSVLHGRPTLGAELSTDFNPLEAALWRAVSFTKGCYIGQETIARLQQDPEVRVKQQLFGLKLGGPVETGTKLYADGGGGGGDAEEEAAASGGQRLAGVVTSVAETAEGDVVALGYVRTRVGAAGAKLATADGVAVEVVDVRLATRSEEECADARRAAADAEEPAAELEPPTAKQLKMAGNLAKMMGEEVPDFASAEACQAWIASKL